MEEQLLTVQMRAPRALYATAGVSPYPRSGISVDTSYDFWDIVVFRPLHIKHTWDSKFKTNNMDGNI